MPLHIADETAVIIYQLLNSASKITNGYANFWPDDSNSDSSRVPINIAVIFDDAARTVNFGSSLIDGYVFEHHGFQVRVRNKSKSGGFTALSTIRDYFDTGFTDQSVTVNGRTYVVEKVTRRRNIFYLGTEEGTSDRYLFALNARATIRRTS